MSLLKVAKNETAFLKAGFMGFQGSGKTYTASRLAAGVLKFAKVKNPKIAMFDTEKSSDFLVDYFAKEKIEFLVVKSHSFKALLDTIKECQETGVHALIIDSITHIWRELMKSYQDKLRRKYGLTMADWGPIKEEWYQFTNAFINSKMHIISLGRAGWEWGQEENEETGKKTLVKLGTKMKAEGEFGYESDILIEMERIRNEKTNTDLHRAWVLKDRFDVLDGKFKDDPTFEFFLPYVQKLAIGGDHVGFDAANSQEIFESPDLSVYEKKKQREIALEELHATLTKLDLAGTSAATQKTRTLLLEEVFGTSSKTAIEGLTAESIKIGIQKIVDKSIAKLPSSNEKDIDFKEGVK